ncbi:DUF3566 domain-containing protein [Tessaracoccus sp. OS52]|uniref:DUF3566 domain-containing protein n=1 Tax=Tessaracoccus sp. OS52 TaxID=2886691 RepID=UPI001D113A96|nr:DUF3566 domain-containing protein [Tessaracoccus sp. OS52]MCC2593798.1 DUF3566 domain-containing protein [Tessaracoccus sp. OS52]
MSDSSPRWPGNNGSPGLDFSARRDAPAEGPAKGGSASRPEGGQGDGPVGANAPRPTRPTPPPFDPTAPPAAAPQNQGTSVQTPSRTDGGAAPTPSDGSPANRNGEAAKPKDLPTPGPQESAASWAWQPLDAEAAGKLAPGAPGARPGRTAGPGAGGAPGRPAPGPGTARVGETGPRPASEVGAAAAAGVIAGAAVRAADQAKQQPGTPRRHTPSSAVSAPRTASLRNGVRRTRKARLRLARLDPWSVMKTTFLFSIAFGIMMMVIAWVLWSVIAGSGALESLNQFLTTLIGNQGDAPFRIEDYINAPRVLGAAAVLAAIDVVILTAVATLFAFLYNLAATVIGGLEVTLAED